MAPPVYTDSPLAVIHTPMFETGKTDPFTVEASHMALSHNSFIRGFNSIYQQAPRVSSADKEDFVGYCLAWHEMITEHHHYEETDFFPNVDKAARKNGLMDGAVHEHAVFHSGMEKFRAYLLKGVVNFRGAELIAIMDSFKDPFYSHLKSEPRAILELAKYDTPETPINITKIAQAAGKKTLTLSFIFNVLPVFLLNMDTLDFEDGMWHEVFPPVKGVIKWIMTKAIPMRHSSRWRFGFKRFVQVSIGSKHFKRLSNVFGNGTPRVTLNAISDRLMKEDPQLHYILRLCQTVTGATQAVRWNNKLDQLHYNQPLEQDKLEEWEFDVLGELSLTVNLVNTMIESIQLPPASPKKGLTYISKLKELMARLDPLKAHTNLRKLPISLDDLTNPDIAKEALSIVDRFSVYAGGPMVPLYQNLNKDFLEDLEVQLQEAKGTTKTKSKRPSTKSVEASRSATSSEQGQGVKTRSVSSRSSNAKMTRVLASFLETKSRVPAVFKTPTKSGNFASPERSARPETPNEPGTPTEQQVPIYSPTPSEVEALDWLQQRFGRPQALADTAPTEPLASEEPLMDARPGSSTDTEPDMASQAPMSAELETSPQMEASAGADASAMLSTSAESASSAIPAEELETSAEADLPADLEKSAEATTAEGELLVGPDPYTHITTIALTEAIAALDLAESQPSDQPEVSADLDADTNKLEEKLPVGQEMSTKPDTTEEISPEVFKVSPSTLEVFSTIFSAFEESESNSGSEPGPKNSIKWLDFGAAMIDIGFSILPSIGSLYTFVPGEDFDVTTFFTLHRPYLSVIWGDRLLLLALRLKMLYGWGKETFEAE